MIDENYEDITSEALEEISASEEVSAPEVSSEPVEADPSLDSELESETDPVEPSDPVEVVSVDDLLDRLNEESQENIQTEEPLPEEELAATSSGSDLPAAIIDGGPFEIIGMDKVLSRLETIQQQTEEHPMMETPFEDYTVTEGLMLLIFVILLLDFFLNILRRWF